MKYLDVGGGLGVDYDGSQTNFYASKNYTMQNYANDIVAELKDACAESKLPVPTLISESGRAIASHQSILILISSVLDVPSGQTEPPKRENPPIIWNLWETYQSINSENYQEAYHDVTQLKKKRSVGLTWESCASLKEPEPSGSTGLVARKF
jgi:arginine decarboxylase